MNIISYNVFGTLDKKKYIKERKKYIIDEIFKNGIPDIICLQEATQPIIDDIIDKLPNYFIWTKLDTIKKISEEDKNILVNDGYIVIISRWKFLEKNLIYKGSFYDDGIMNVIIDTKKEFGFNFSIYNVHTSGGTFGKSAEIVKKKQEGRIKELKLLNAAIKKDKMKNILIMGDFNLDSNDIKNYPELKYSPEYQNNNIYDIWKMLKPKMVGATEDEFINLFRAAMKIKKKQDKRKVRYDKILFKGDKIKPNKIKLIGNKKINNKAINKVKIIGKNELGEKSEKLTYLFPSDHFGLFTQIKIISF